jgi:hypothetical protein
MKRKKKRYRAWFKVSFDPMMWISSTQQYFIASRLTSKVANCPSKLIDILFLPWGQVVLDKK